MVQKEQHEGGIRAQWFTNDFQQLQDLSSGQPHPENLYFQFDWKTELDKFWRSIHLTPDELPPLFSVALKDFFGEDDDCESIEQMTVDARKFRQMKLLLMNTQNDFYLKKANNVNPRSRKYKRPPFNVEVDNLRSMKDDALERKDYTIPIPPPSSARRSCHSAYRNNSQPSETSHRSALLSRDEIKMPPISSEAENASFALAAVCGPSQGPIHVLAVRFIPETAKIIAATVGGEDRGDKSISIWDVRADTLLTQLNNSTSKPVTCLLFHPSYPNLLLSADMSCDVKLWNWEECKLVRWWKKHHSRIIFQLGFVPGDDTRYVKCYSSAISCSGDQSLRIWNIHSDKTHRGSLHANEPITSFTFCGSETDPHQQKVVVSLSSSIRIYKLRTLQLLHSINLRDMKPT